MGGGIQVDRFLEVNSRNVMILLLPRLFFIMVGIVVFHLFRFDKYFVEGVFAFWILDLLLAAYLHLIYLLRNRGETYEVHDTKLIRRKGKEETVYKSDEVDKIVFYLSPALYNDHNFYLLTLEGYHYALIKLKTGEELVLTCLLAPRIDKSLRTLKGVRFEKRKRMFCAFSLKYFFR